MQWYYSRNSTQLGPVSEQELRAKIMTGEVSGTDNVWREGMGDWQQVSAVEELRTLIPDAAAGVSQGGYAPYTPPGAGPAAPFVTGKPTSGLAIASLICGVAGLVSCLLPGIAAVICGHMALNRIEAADSKLDGRGMAIAGLVLGYLSILVLVLVVAFMMLSVVLTGRVESTPVRSSFSP
jgi:hypothetical protein